VLQSWRVEGFVFLSLYAVRLLPGTFAIPAGVGDVLVGLTAPLVATTVVRRLPAWRGIYLGWTALGVADLVVALSLGVLTTLTPLGLVDGAPAAAHLTQLPLSLIPTFGMPLLLIVHLASVLVVRGSERATPGSDRTAALPVQDLSTLRPSGGLR
jgi:hypothetical protein